MPELPEVETVRRGLADALTGARIGQVRTNRRGLRYPFPARFASRLKGRRIDSIGRRAKYLLFFLDSGEVLLAHLGMSGSFRVVRGGSEAMAGRFRFPRSKAQTHDHVVIAAEGAKGGLFVIYNDPRRFGFMDLVAAGELERHPRIAGLGIEPLSDAFDGTALARLFAGRSTPLKSALLDQRLVAGIGNIYACEALWQARLAPQRNAGGLATASGKATTAAHRLAREIRDVLARAIAAGGSTLHDFRQADGEPGNFQSDFSVYGREGDPCPRCGGAIRRVAQSGRSTFHCPTCQR
jgi:formamidopyrimidine-DNA glycosylase